MVQDVRDDEQKKNDKELGAVSATAVDAVPCSVPASSASHVAPLTALQRVERILWPGDGVEVRIDASEFPLMYDMRLAIIELRALRQQLVEFERVFSEGYDAHGCVGLREPYSWESCARVALDLAHSVGNGAVSLSEALGSVPSAAPKDSSSSSPITHTDDRATS